MSEKDDQVRRRWGDEAAGEKAPEKENEGAKVDALLRQVEPLIEQVNSLYQLFIAGAESLPPNERRKQLEQAMASLIAIPKPNSTYQFRATTLQVRFTTYRERWERMMKDLESGKIKRPTGAKR